MPSHLRWLNSIKQHRNYHKTKVSHVGWLDGRPLCALVLNFIKNIAIPAWGWLGGGSLM